VGPKCDITLTSDASASSEVTVVVETVSIARVFAASGLGQCQAAHSSFLHDGVRAVLL
jgi:hypothetical protein